MVAVDGQLQAIPGPDFQDNVSADVPSNEITATLRAKSGTVHGFQFNGNAGVTFEGFDKAEEHRLSSLVWGSNGLTGTGWCGEIRDMLAMLEIVRLEIGGEIEIPEATQLASDEEERTSPLTLGEGMCW